MTNNITLTKSGIGTVRIFTEKVEEVYEKKLNFIRIPRPKNKWGLGAKTQIVDFLIIVKIFNIHGYITGYGGDNAQQQRAKLRQMIEAGGGVTLNYDGTNYNVNFNKCSITEEGTDEDTPQEYGVMLSLVVGGDR